MTATCILVTPCTEFSECLDTALFKNWPCVCVAVRGQSKLKWCVFVLHIFCFLTDRIS